ncbi:MAG: hypothetical protein COB04_07415 [Gammaproteobacteria bacterium]|nr:MAG: hypothetical protein COB04_07415 [Gammaproteobacteria bacterium]
MGSATPLFITLIILGIALSGFYVKHSLHQARLNRAVKIAELRDRARRFDHILTYFPPQYLSKELKVIVIDEILSSLTAILTMCNNAKISDLRAKAKLKKEEIKQDGEFDNPRPITTIDEANDIRALTADLHRHITSKYKHRKLDKKTAKRLLTHLKILMAQTVVDINVYKANEAQDVMKFRLAVQYYRRAKEELKKAPQNSFIRKQDEALDGAIRKTHNLEIEALKKQVAANPNKLSTLSQGVEEQIDEDDNWKKKYF